MDEENYVWFDEGCIYERGLVLDLWFHCALVAGVARLILGVLFRV